MKITLFTQAVLINIGVAIVLAGYLIFASSPATPLAVAISGIVLFPLLNIILLRKATQASQEKR